MMRLISQSGRIDIPYTNTSLEITSEDGCHVVIACFGKKRFSMGHYYQLTNALNALVDVSRANTRGWKIFTFPQED
jgi:hypothetical protein